MSRGRGRGRGKPFAGLDALLPGEPPPPPILTPPPLFPPMEKRPLELRKSEVDTFLLTIKQEMRQFMQQSPFALKTSSGKKEIDRYSDKYKQFKGSEIDDFIEWHPDWKFFPSELRIGVKRRKRTASEANFRPTIPAQKARKGGKKVGAGTIDGRSGTTADSDSSSVGKSTQKKVTFTGEKLDPLAKLDESAVRVKEEKEEGEEGEGEEVVEEEYYDEEIEEEDTDYNMTYFDNGEEYGGEDDEPLEDGPYY